MKSATLRRLNPTALAGSFYGVLLNFRGDVESLGDKVRGAPYQAPPRAPVLYVKPRNTHGFDGSAIPMPPEAPALQVAATLGLLFGRTATRVTPAQALACIAGLVVLTEVAIPHEDIFRPALRQRCRDGFSPIGPYVVDFEPPLRHEFGLRTYINGELQCESTARDLVRSIDVLVSDISQFMSLRAGDLLSLGMPRNAPTAKIGDVIAADIPSIGRIENRIVAQTDWSSES